MLRPRTRFRSPPRGAGYRGPSRPAGRFGCSQGHPSRCRPPPNGSLLLSLRILYTTRLVPTITDLTPWRAPGADLVEAADGGTPDPASAAAAPGGRPPG